MNRTATAVRQPRVTASSSPTVRLGTSGSSSSTRTTGMLVLTRKCSETIEISGGIRITLIDARSGRARLGITAPADVNIVRGELASGSRLNTPSTAAMAEAGA